MTLSNYDKTRLDDIARILTEIKDDHLKDELLGAAKWAAVSSATVSFIDVKLNKREGGNITTPARNRKIKSEPNLIISVKLVIFCYSYKHFLKEILYYVSI